MIDDTEVPRLPGTPVSDPDGRVIGVIDRVYLDPNHEAPGWFSVRTGIPGTPECFVPLTAARQHTSDNTVRIAFSQAVIEAAPYVENSNALPLDDIHELDTYYRALMPSSTLPDVPDQGAPLDENGAVMVRSEERLRIRTVPVPVERVRIEKRIVEEQRTVTVTLRREEIHITREPLSAGDVAPSPEARTHAPHDEVTIVLHEEQLRIEKDVVPTERVRIHVLAVADERQVTDTVDAEQIVAEHQTS